MRELDEVAAAHLDVARGVDPVRDREEQLSRAALVRRSARARAAAGAAAAARGLARKVRHGRLAAPAAEGEARDEHAGLRRLARRADLRGVALGEPGQHLELLGAALAPILVDGHLNAGF